MDELTAWLTQIWDEDEAIALATEHPDGKQTLQWRPADQPRRVRFDNGSWDTHTSVFAGDWDRIWIMRDGVRGGPLASHIARHDPATVLVRIAAERRLLEEYATRDQDVDLMLGPDIPRQRQWSGLRLAVQVIASGYADRPGYREEWRP